MQHLNLYSQLDQKVELPFCAKHQLWIISSIVVLMLCSYVFIYWGIKSLEQQLQQLDDEQKEVADQLELLRVEKSRQQKNNQLLDELRSLQREVVFRRTLIGSITPKNVQRENFSEHLSGLARQQIKGMWFTEIQLLKGGQELALTGKTQKPEYVPRYVQKLSQEKIFNGHQFRVFRMSKAKDAVGILEFNLRAHDVEQLE